jgi:hypothetical protein
MKKTIYTIISVMLLGIGNIVFSRVLAQETNTSKINAICRFDKIICQLKHKDIKTLSAEIVNTFRNSLGMKELNKDTMVLKLYTLLNIENPSIDPDTLMFYLEDVRTYETVYELYNKLNKKIEFIEENMSDHKKHSKDIYLGGLNRNLKIVEDHMKHILDYYYCQYKNINTSNQVIKGIYLETDNDLFAYNNKDMNYTGGGRIEMTTDYLKMQLLPFLNKEKILSYQGIFFGFRAYTPFIRDTNIFKNDSSYDINDRPFASFSYIGRSKYRIHSSGHIRMRSELKIGFIGGNVGNIVQSIIHRDQFVTSLKPNGWDSQIAKGGRFAWNIDHYLDFMLFSGKGDIFNLNRNKPAWLNIPVMFELHIGNELTALGAGIGLSNLSFKDRSGYEDIKLPKTQKLRFLISADAKYSYVIHNSMLEGIGIFKTFPNDDDPLAPKDVYRLEANEVVRHLFLAEIFIGLRIKKATVYYKLTINSKEYNKPKAKDIYQWARIGVNFLI